MQVSQKYISEEELSTHNKKDDLWMSIHGKIYNVTDWANHHPGGRLPFMYFAGQDVTDVFLAYHPQSVSQNLNRFFTGYYLKNYTPSEVSQNYKKLLFELQKMDLFDQKGHGMLILVLITIMMLSASVYGVIYSNNIWVHLACAALLGFSWIQCGWITHDTGHYQTMSNPKLNHLALFVFTNCIVGVTGAGWKRHHDTHHISTNFLEFDPDTHFVPFLVCSSEYLRSLTSNYYRRKLHFDSLFKFFISHQDLTHIIFMILGRFFGHVQSLFFLLSSKKTAKNCLEILGLIVFWTWYSLLLSIMPNWSGRIAFTVIALAVAGIQNILFFLNHFSCHVYLGAPDGNDWVKKQIVGTLDIKCSPWMDWFHGGLQFQIEHHLFPKMPKCQLRRISPLVKDFCRKNNLPYNCANSFWEACRLTSNTICEVALEVRTHVHPISKD